jgi:hypothetical protein
MLFKIFLLLASVSSCSVRAGSKLGRRDVAGGANFTGIGGRLESRGIFDGGFFCCCFTSSLSNLLLVAEEGEVRVFRRAEVACDVAKSPDLGALLSNLFDRSSVCKCRISM